MGQSKDALLRHKIIAGRAEGLSYKALSADYGVSYNTVRSLCHRYAAEGAAGLVVRTARCGRRTSSVSERSYRLVRLVAHRPPSWGIAYILLRIRLQFPTLVLQSTRHYQRRVRRQQGRLPRAVIPKAGAEERSRQAHDTWQIDAKERLHFTDSLDEQGCFLNITDEKTSALLQATAFPLGRISQVPLSSIRSVLIAAFQKWGFPKAIRTDNGEPFGVPTRDAVPILSLWLLAWGIQPICNRPRRPQDNAQVERNQGTAGRWAEVEYCPNVAILQARLNEAATMQRDHYPVKKLGSVPRTTLFQDLLTTKRPFDQSDFDEKRAYDYLAKVIYPRKVSAGGTICIHNKPFQAGLRYRGQVVFVKFDPQALSWIVLDTKQSIIKTIPDQRFSKENLFNLTFYQ